MGVDLIGRVCAHPPAIVEWSPARVRAEVRPPVQQTTPLQPSLVEHLQRTWKAVRLAAVPSRDMPTAINELIQHHVHVGFFGNRTDGMRRLTGFGPDGTLEIQLAPNRNKVPIVTNIGSSETCDLCEPPFPEERGLSWRNWRVWPNAFPYLPPEYEHILLTCADHLEQSFSTDILGDMIDFQTCAAGKRQLTMHYNGIAGNSQVHLHWQACRATPPLQRELDSGRIQANDLVRGSAGRVGAFDQGSFCGILVEGDKSFVLRWADRLVRHLESDPSTRGAYNLVLLQPRSGQPRLVVFPRRADNLDVRADGFRVGIGGFNAAGIFVVPRPGVTQKFTDELGAVLRSTLVPPSELPWLESLGKESSVTLPWAQALLPHAA